MKNVLLITIDSLRSDFCGFINDSINITPNLNKIAKESLVYTNAFSVATQTLPSFFSMFTGHYPSVCPSKSLNPSIFSTIAYRFREFEYITLGIHSNPFLRNFSKGFDYFYDIIQPNQKIKEKNQLPMEESQHARSSLNLKIINKLKKTGILSFLKTYPKLFYYTHALENYFLPACAGADKTRENFEQLYKHIVKKNKDSKPFFFWAHFMDVHHPYYPPKKFTSISFYKQVKLNAKLASKVGKIKMRPSPNITKGELRQLKELYKGTIRFIDEEIGKIIEFLKEEDIYDDTVVIITADHGDGFLEHGFLGHQPALYDELLHIPLLIKNDNLKGRQNSLVSLIDLPKVFENNFTMPNKDKIFAEIRVGNEYDYIAYRNIRYKLIIDKKHGAVELYDLKNEKIERNNIAQDNKDVVKELLKHAIKHIEICTARRREILKMRDLAKGLRELK